MTIVGEGGERDRWSIQLATKRGTFVNNLQAMEKLPQGMADMDSILRAEHPGIRTRSLSATYNCVGMVFAARRTVIETKYLRLLLEEDGYVRIHERSDVEVGDVIVYRHEQQAEIEHVGVVAYIRTDVEAATRNFAVLSQWGRQGEYLHPEDHVPAVYGDYREFYTERTTYNA